MWGREGLECWLGNLASVLQTASSRSCRKISQGSGSWPWVVALKTDLTMTLHPLTSCVSSGRYLHLSEPPYPPCETYDSIEFANCFKDSVNSSLAWRHGDL